MSERPFDSARARQELDKHITGDRELNRRYLVTQCERVLAVLQDGQWHSSLTFARLDRPILSYTRRIFELRKAGYKIEGKQVGNIHFYRLVEGGTR